MSPDAPAVHGAAGDDRARPPDWPRTLVLVGLMGAGKSCIGRRLAQQRAVPFADSDAEVERAAGMSIPEIFETYGEASFRDCERRVIARMLRAAPHVMAVGGGAFMNPDTRELIQRRAISVWLRADLDLLVRRTGKRNTRPLLQRGDPRQILSDLMDERHPVYAEADLTVDSVDGPPEATVERVLQAVDRHVASGHAGPPEAVADDGCIRPPETASAGTGASGGAERA
jgi:shikimate kinase